MTDTDLARKFLDVIPAAMRAVRAEMRGVARPDLTIPQFRILAIVSRGGRARSTNAECADLLGVSEPATCRMVSVLVKQGLIRQLRNPGDRRQVYLELTTKGRNKFDAIKSKASLRFREEFAKLEPAKKAAIRDGLLAIQEVFG